LRNGLQKSLEKKVKGIEGHTYVLLYPPALPNGGGGVIGGSVNE
jgi:hypothetical protein